MAVLTASLSSISHLTFRAEKWLYGLKGHSKGGKISEGRGTRGEEARERARERVRLQDFVDHICFWTVSRSVGNLFVEL